MKIHLVGKPLDRFPIMLGSNPLAFESALEATFGSAHVEVSDPDGFNGCLNFRRLKDIELAYSCVNVPTRLRIPSDGFAGIQLPLKGTARSTIRHRRIPIDTRRACVCPADEDRRCQFQAGFQQLVLGVRQTALEVALAAALGGRPNQALVFEAEVDVGLPRPQNLRQLAIFLSGTLNSEETGLSPAYVDELEQAAAVAFLYACNNNFSYHLNAPVTDTSVRHVSLIEDYIQAHWNEAITIAKLSELAGVSARALFKAFQRSRGYSPMAFAKRVRMEHVRERLIASGGEASIGAIAKECGFPHFGYFSKEYRSMFGEKPSTTLARASKSLDS